ncbi:MAG: hypothetical protein IRZ21_11470 [Thermoleophilaceae bacterium]|nr:hypothetical protein [Thermoleophilaceae bacterium]
MERVPRSRRRERTPDESATGFVLRATARGALVLQTENARRMMQRLARFAPGDERRRKGSEEEAAPAEP